MERLVIGICGGTGSGKTTLANIIANSTSGHFVKLNAVNSGVADVKRVADEAKESTRLYGKKTYLLLDECHRFNKIQSDSLLPLIEQGTIIFIGSTTENPFASMTPAIVSRCRVFEFKKLTDEMSATFADGFAKIRANFGRIFKELFGGGRDAIQSLKGRSAGECAVTNHGCYIVIITTQITSGSHT